MNINKAIIIGRLGADPDVRSTENSVVANMSVATSEKYKDTETTEWHKVVAWGRTAEICRDYLKKGSLAYFEGKIQTRKWTDKEGVTKYTTEIIAQQMRMMPKLDNAKPTQNTPVISEDVDDDLPF